LALLRTWRQQVLPAALARDIATHVESCPLCLTLLDDLGRLAQPGITSAERARIRRRLPVVAPPIRISGWHWHAIALATATLVAAATWLAIRDAKHPEEARATQLPFFAQPAKESANETYLRTSSPIISQIVKLAPPTNVADSLAREGSSAMPKPSPQQLATAFDAYVHGDYSLATEQFSQLAKRFPRSGLPFLYLGVTQLLIHNDSEALFNLTRAEQFVSPDQKDSAAWYHAMAALRTGASNAGELLHSLCDRKQSPYAQQACRFEKHP
jgi:hypothetical protein